MKFNVSPTKVEFFINGFVMGVILTCFLFGWHSRADQIKVMVIDSGVDAWHKDIQSHVVNPFGDDWYDWHGHGTHIAGLVVKDTCPSVKLYSCKYIHNSKYEMNLENTIKCFQRAYDEHMDFINYSSGGAEYSTEEFNIFKKLSVRGTVITAAAGNEHNDITKIPYYPASYGFANVIVVGNLDGTQPAYSSNWGFPGMVWEHGTGVRSTLPNNNYGMMSGTSQATAIYMNKLLKKRCLEVR